MRFVLKFIIPSLVLTGLFFAINIPFLIVGLMAVLTAMKVITASQHVYLVLVILLMAITLAMLVYVNVTLVRRVIHSGRNNC